MGLEYVLVNETKKEIIYFSKLPVGKAREIAGNPVSAAITTWYMLHNRFDNISFFSDEEFASYIKKDKSIVEYPDLTEEVLDKLISVDILRDNGILYKDEDDPNLYLRNIINI